MWNAGVGKGVEEAITRAESQDIHAVRIPQGIFLKILAFIYIYIDANLFLLFLFCNYKFKEIYICILHVFIPRVEM